MRGGVLSITVIVDVHVETLLKLSITVKVTVFAPRLAQVNVLGETVIDAIPQLSVEPLLICDAVIEACPLASRYIVAFLQLATGGVASA